VGVKYLPWVLAVALGGLAYWQNCYQEKLAVEETKLETVYVERTKTLTRVRQITDSFIKTDTVFRDTTVQRLVKDERAACDAVVEACEKRVANLKKQLRPGWLMLFGEADYALAPFDKPLLKGDLSSKVGISLRIQRDLYLRAYRFQPLAGDTLVRASWNVGIRKDLRLF
jgi:hypothetical protein